MAGPESDSTVIGVDLIDYGRTILRELTPDHNAYIASQFSQLDDLELNTLHRLLNHLVCAKRP